MLITNIADYVTDPQGELTEMEFHIPDSPYYEELGMPFRFCLDSYSIVNIRDEYVAMNLMLLDSLDWELLDE